MKKFLTLLMIAGVVSFSACKGGDNKEGDGKEGDKKEETTDPAEDHSAGGAADSLEGESFEKEDGEEGESM